MRQSLYIRAATAISPQNTFERETFLNPVLDGNEGRLYVVDADYSKYISPVAIRRMSRLLKMAISAAMQCLKDAGVDCPDAIITGTGRGLISDMENFLKDMIRLNEEALNPTLFIQSTYNSPNGWIAMQSKCTNYNQTYVQRGSSLELAVLDAQLLVAENGAAQNILVGCYDEMTDDHFIIKNKIGYWKQPAPSSTPEVIKHSDTSGSIAGEGTAFFVLSGEKGDAKTIIKNLRIIQDANADNVTGAVAEALGDEGITANDIDLLLTGLSGDARFQSLYSFTDSFDKEKTAIGAFKHLSGEFDTATGFGLWVADHIIRNQRIPAEIIIEGAAEAINYVLLVNHYIHGTATVVLLQKV